MSAKEAGQLIFHDANFENKTLKLRISQSELLGEFLEPLNVGHIDVL